MPGHRRNADHAGLRYDAAKPRLATMRQIRKAKEMREELNGESHKKALSKVTLPKFSWEKEDDQQG